MDSLSRIFGLVNEAKKSKKGKACIPTHHEKKGGEKVRTGKSNPYDHDHVSESKKLSKKQKKIARMAGDPNKIDSADLAALRASKKKVNASTEIMNILNLIKEAYQDELISEEAFLAIADPIMRSLMEEENVDNTIAGWQQDEYKKIQQDEADKKAKADKNANEKKKLKKAAAAALFAKQDPSTAEKMRRGMGLK